MAKLNIVSKKVNMDLTDIVKYQLLTYFYINKVTINESDLACITLLAITGETDINQFCVQVYQNKIFGSIQTVRNCLVKLEKQDLIQKDITKKLISITSKIVIQTTGNILLDYKFIHIATTEV